MHIHKMSWLIAVTLIGCAASQPPQSIPPERKALTQEECAAQSGNIVGDIGDGATHRSDYVCPSGKPPLGDIAPPAAGPIAIEGSVCCPR